MRQAKILDCTLRDGAYLMNKKFGNENINGIIRGLMKANVDIIEIGFLQDEGTEEGCTVFRNASEAARFIPQNRGNTMFAVLADYSRYSTANLECNDGTGFDIVRACFFKNERKDVLEFCRDIRRKGYKLFVQPVDISGYSDRELIELIEDVNLLEPYGFSIVDTFGSMYTDDLKRIFSLVNHNLDETIKIGLHSHNNMQMSSALSQEFLGLLGNRVGVIDTTISGMGRGAGNTPTELVAQYMNSKLNYSYDIDAILDIIDNYMENIRTKCKWGYSTEFFLAGAYGAHVNNIAYLKKKNSLESKDLRYILNKLTALQRKRYDYDLLEKMYMEALACDVDDCMEIEKLSKAMGGQDILILAPGKSIKEEACKIKTYVREKHPVVIGVNHMNDLIPCNYLFISNYKRYEYYKGKDDVGKIQKIITSNINCGGGGENVTRVSMLRLIKCGWLHFDNSAVLLLRLLDGIGAASIAIAGLDGYSHADNYATDQLEMANSYDDPQELNRDIRSMLLDYAETRKSKETEVLFLTESRFDDIHI